MADYIETKTKDGVTIRIEVEGLTKTTAGFGGRLPAPTNVSGEMAAGAYAQALETIRACARGFIDTLHGLEVSPSAASVDFAVKIDAEAGAMVAKSPGDAQFKVSLSWKKAESEDDD